MRKLIYIITAVLLLAFASGANAVGCFDAEPDINDCKVQAEQGNAIAQTILGMMYDKGKGVSQDDKEAVYWYSKAAEQGNAIAQTILGMMYDKGKGVSQDDKKAVYWYRKAAEQGIVEAQNNLGLMYATGEGVSQDHKKAFEWYSKAAEQGYAKAEYNLGVMHEKGEGVPADAEKAVYWYSKAAEQGHAKAQRILTIKKSGFDKKIGVIDIPIAIMGIPITLIISYTLFQFFLFYQQYYVKNADYLLSASVSMSLTSIFMGISTTFGYGFLIYLVYSVSLLQALMVWGIGAIFKFIYFAIEPVSLPKNYYFTMSSIGFVVLPISAYYMLAACC